MTAPEPSPATLWTVARAAKELSMSEAHIYRMVRDKRIPFCRVGNSIRFSPAELTKWINSRTVPAVR